MNFAIEESLQVNNFAFDTDLNAVSKFVAVEGWGSLSLEYCRARHRRCLCISFVAPSLCRQV